jgi:hypothetical protein
MKQNNNFEIGSWVRFYNNGRLVIGVVQYYDRNILGHIEYMTDIGTIDERYILESR